jgi:penicillin-binding protein 2
LCAKALIGDLSSTSAKVFAGAGLLSGSKTGTAQAVTIGQKDRDTTTPSSMNTSVTRVYMDVCAGGLNHRALAVIVENAGWGAGGSRTDCPARV